MAHSPAQQAVIDYDGPDHMLVIAGPGSGKTSTIVARAARLSEMGKGMNLLLLTFSRKAAKEIDTRLRAQVRHVPLVSTYHGLGWWFVRRDPALFGFPVCPTLLDETDARRMRRELLFGGKGNASVDDVLDAFLERLSHEETLEPAYVEQIAEKHLMQTEEDFPFDAHRLAEFFLNYQEEKRKNGLVDYFDLQFLPLQKMKEAPRAFDWFFERFHEVFIDEAQDTNLAQMKLVEKIGKENPSVRLIQVGDDDQTIYGWRGACHDNLVRFQKIFAPQIFYLNDNFRSHERIVTSATRLIRHNEDRFDKNPIVRRQGEGVIEAQHYAHDGLMLDAMIESVERSAKAGQVAIIVRTNRLVEAVERKLLGAGLDYTVQQGVDLIEHRETKLMMSLIRLAANPHDFMAFKTCATALISGLGDKGIERIGQLHDTAQSRGTSQGVLNDVIEAVTAKGKIPSWWPDFERLVHMTKWLGQTFPESPSLVPKLIDEELIKKWFEKIEPNARQRKIRYSRLELLRESLAMHVPESIEEPVDAWRSSMEFLLTGHVREKKSSRIVVMTAHQAKGLEFDAVFLPFLCQGIFPSRRTEDIEEERRLMYVAMTRARHTLWMGSCARILCLPEYEKERFAPSSYFREAGIVLDAKNEVKPVRFSAQELVRRIAL